MLGDSFLPSLQQKILLNMVMVYGGKVDFKSNIVMAVGHCQWDVSLQIKLGFISEDMKIWPAIISPPTSQRRQAVITTIAIIFNS